MKRLATLAGATLLAGTATAFAQPGMLVMQMDEDGDGLVSRVEFQPPDERRGRGPMADADTDGDGAVSRGEMEVALEAAIAGRTATMRERMTARFDAMDADGDGIVTREEAAEQAFLRMDANGDGFISEDEARSRRHRPRGDRMGRPGPGGPDGWPGA